VLCWFSSSSWCSCPPPTAYGRLNQHPRPPIPEVFVWVEKKTEDPVWPCIPSDSHRRCGRTRQISWSDFVSKSLPSHFTACVRENQFDLYTWWATLSAKNKKHIRAWRTALLMQIGFGFPFHLCVPSSVSDSSCYVCSLLSFCLSWCLILCNAWWGW